MIEKWPRNNLKNHKVTEKNAQKITEKKLTKKDLEKNDLKRWPKTIEKWLGIYNRKMDVIKMDTIPHFSI